jgi:hypothetical protein
MMSGLRYQITGRQVLESISCQCIDPFTLSIASVAAIAAFYEHALAEDQSYEYYSTFPFNVSVLFFRIIVMLAAKHHPRFAKVFVQPSVIARHTVLPAQTVDRGYDSST